MLATIPMSGTNELVEGAPNRARLLNGRLRELEGTRALGGFLDKLDVERGERGLSKKSARQ